MNFNKAFIVIGSILVVSITLIYFLVVKQDTGQEMFAKHFDKYPNMVSPEDRESDKKGAKFDTVMTPYEQGQYGEALNTFNQFLKRNPDNQTIRFYRGIAYLQEDQFERAVDDFKRVIIKWDNLRVQATWYLGLTYLKMGNQQKASFYLQQLIRNKSNYANNAKEILKKLGTSNEDDRQRVYRIDDEENYLLTYRKSQNQSPKQLSAKSFYIHTRFLDILPERITYKTFNDLSKEEQRLLTIRGQQQVLTGMDNTISDKKLATLLKRADSLIASFGNKKEQKGWLETKHEYETTPDQHAKDNQVSNVVQLTEQLQQTTQMIENKEDSLNNMKKRYKKTTKKYQDELLKVATALKEEGKEKQAEAIMDHAPQFREYLETYFHRTKQAHLGEGKIPAWFVKEVKQDLSTLDRNQQPPNMPDKVFKARKHIQDVLRSALESSQGRIMPDEGGRDDAEMHTKLSKYEVMIEQLASIQNNKYQIQKLQNNKLQLVASIVDSEDATQGQANKESL